MPTYDYKCEHCEVVEEKFVKVSDLDNPINCQCGNTMKRLISLGHGGTHGDEAPWLASTTEFIKDGEEETIYKHPVSSRTEYKQLLKEKGLTPKC